MNLQDEFYLFLALYQMSLKLKKIWLLHVTFILIIKSLDTKIQIFHFTFLISLQLLKETNTN
jgi:hypothetical protein